MGTLSDFDLYIEDHHVTTGADGNYHYYLHAVMDKELLDKATSDESKRRTALSEEVVRLVAEGDSFVKTGYELKAVQNYMRAMAAGYESDFISDEYSYDELYPVVYELLQSMNITITNARPSDAVCTVVVSRKGMFASSAVAGAEIMAEYLAVDTRGIEYDDSFVYISDEGGTFTFNSINNSILRTGSIEFSLNLSDELAALEKVAPGEKTQALRDLVASKNVRFDYSKTFRSGSIAVAVIEHDELGYVTGVHEITDYLTEKFISDGAAAAAFYAELDDEDDVIYEFNHSGRRETVMIVIRTGVVDIVRSRLGLSVASVEGLVDKTAGDAKTGVQIVLRSMEEPLRQIALNAGIDGAVIIDTIRRSGKAGYGYDALKGEYVDMIERGIIDPTKVTRSALQNAASVAAMVLTTESLVTDIPAPEPAAPAANPGMGGMY